MDDLDWRNFVVELRLNNVGCKCNTRTVAAAGDADFNND